MEVFATIYFGICPTEYGALLITTTVVFVDGRVEYDSIMRRETYWYITHLNCGLRNHCNNLGKMPHNPDRIL
jgi:hypothetical protein